MVSEVPEGSESQDSQSNAIPSEQARTAEAIEPQAPKALAPENEALEGKVPETTFPETKDPETKVPEPTVPDAETHENEAPEATAPEATAPEVKAPEPVSFDSLSLQPPLREAIRKMGFEHCTPIQGQSLVHTLAGHDVTGRAQTGTGKTAAFLITIINDLLCNPVDERYLAEPRALVVAPTRELAIQIASDAQQLTQFTDLHTVTLVGGEDYQKQNRALDKKPVDIVVATPGRLLDFVQNDNLYLGLIELLVLDEADRMLDMGFIPQVRAVVARTPKKDCRQTLLFSATFTPMIMELATRWAMDPIMVEIEPEKVAADAVDQIVYLVTTADKYNLLYNILSEPGAEKVIVFSNRRDQVRKLADNLHRNGIDCGLLSGEVAQNKRISTLEAFKTNKLKVLVATDVAGRGLHINDVTHVVNYTLPEEPEDYVHRIGRTGRAGAIGTSISFACEEDSFLLPDIEEKLGTKLECTHPAEELLVKAPSYTRSTKFKAKEPAGSRPARRPSRPR
ncbi:MAG: ATP-dependent RNA helicase RhlB [Pseudohongiellaceae bacterium]